MSLGSDIEDRLQSISKWAVPFVIFFPVGVFVIYMSYIMGMFSMKSTGIFSGVDFAVGMMMGFVSIGIILIMNHDRGDDINIMYSMMLAFTLSTSIFLILRGVGVVWT